MMRFCATMVFLMVSLQALAGERVETSLENPPCVTFTVGESGHSDRCEGVAGYQLIIHDRRDRIDLEIVRPGKTRNAQVLRLSDYLGPGRRDFRQKQAAWLLNDHNEPTALSLDFDVEPQAYQESLPFTLVIRLGRSEDCIVATIGEGSRRTLDDIFGKLHTLRCRTPFPTD